MSTVTLQLGQAGNQLGSELFSVLAEELRSGQNELSPAADAFFYMAQVGGETRLTARSVVLDMEPKVVQRVALAGKGRWHYSKLGQLTRQSGSGNNWAMGYCFHGPQVERCDSFGGFLLLQSVAGGTGSGLGTYLAEQLREEYPQDPMLSHCIWPYETGEVVVQPYNSLLTLSHLSRQCNGVLLVENEALNATCLKQLGVQRPSLGDLNSVAARNLASVLLPAVVRPAEGSEGSGRGSSSSSSQGGARLLPGRGAARGGGRPAWDDGFNDGGSRGLHSSSSSSSSRGQRGSGSSNGGAAAWDGSFSTGSRWDDEPARASGARGRGGKKPGQLRILGDICDHLCAHPSYRLLTLRSVPQVPPGHVDFTVFNWPALMKRLKQMQATGRTLEAGMDWAPSPGSRLSSGGNGGRSSAANKSLASLLVLRRAGLQARETDASPLQDPALYPSWQPDPLLVAASPQRFAKLDMSATLLTNCQTPVGPISRMLGKASRLYDVRAYVHQYQRYGLECAAFDQAFETTEDILAKYQALY
ncbi:hypothetical protein N2152v2_009854 [Parachlorella kessleri]